MFMLQWINGINKAYKQCRIFAYFRKSILSKEIESKYINAGVAVITGNIPENGSSISLKNRKKVRADIKSILDNNRIDVVHINSSAMGFNSIILFEASKHGIPVRITHSHGKNINNGLKKLYLPLLRLYIKSTATKYAGCSMDAGKYMFGEKGICSVKWNFIPNTIDAKRYSYNEVYREEYRKRLGIGNDTKLIGATGQLISIKNHSFLLDVLSELKRYNEKVKLIVLGEGELRGFLEEKINKLGLVDDVYLLGVSNEIPQWLSAMDYYVMPSLTEGLPLGAIEAQASGLYCLLSQNVPNDVDLSSDVFHISINDGARPWMDLISKLPQKQADQRINGESIVNAAGFDISKTSEYVKKLYSITG